MKTDPSKDVRLEEEKLLMAQEQLALAVSASDIGTWHVILADMKVLANKVFRVHFWMEPGIAIDVPMCLAGMHPDDVGWVQEAINAAIYEGKSYDVEYRTVSPKGEMRWIRALGRTTHGPDGAPLYFDGITLDTTERKESERERERLLEAEQAARQEAERAGHVKDEFLSTLSHELRTPLTAILGWVQILQANPELSVDLRAGLQTIERNARAQARIIDDLLDMSRIISGKVRLDVQPIMLSSVLQEAIQTVRPAAEAKEVEMVLEIDPRVGSMSGDPNRLQQVFWNLLSNAVKFTPRGGMVQVQLERVDSHIEISVIDNGKGIEPEFLPHVFDRFRQADGSMTREHGGLGLGLAIVKQLVESHGGRVVAHSAGLGQGSCFQITLPISTLQSTLERRPEICVSERDQPLPAAFTQGVNLAGVKALVVDDEEETRKLMERLLETAGVEVLVAGSAATALQLVQESLPSIVISDIGMPGETGYTLITKIRQLGAKDGGEIPAIALTAYTRPEDRAKALMAGFQMHITKPADASELLAAVASLTGRLAR